LIPEDPWKLFYMKKSLGTHFFIPRMFSGDFLVDIFSCLTVSLSPRTVKLNLQHSNRYKNKMLLTQEVYLKG
jgi:hypothetical protein